MSTELSPCWAGDVGEVRSVILSGVEDLSNVNSIVTHVEMEGASTTLATSIVDANTSEIQIELGSAVDDWLPARPDPGVWKLIYVVTFNDNSKLTWPQKDGDYICVQETIAPA